MPTTTTRWIDQRRASLIKQKRAGIVCVDCHERKIKCDLQAQTEAGQTRCSRCIRTQQDCHLRTSRRGFRQPSNRASGRNNSTSESETARLQHSPSLHDPTQPNAGAGSANDVLQGAICTPLQDPSATDERTSIQYLHPAPEPPLPQMISTNPNEATNSFTSQAGQFIALNLTVNHSEPPVAAQSGSHVGNTTESWSEMVPQSSRNKNHELYLAEGGFLTVYTQEARDYTNGLKVGSAEESLSRDLPGPDMMQIFTETYFNYCYAFCPVLDRDSLATDLARYPILVNALALTASQIQPSRLSSTKPETYYNRAKHIFYNEEETNPIASLQAVALFYWWSPRPSPKTPQDGAWWWSATGIRRAQQLGFHRQLKPSLSNPSSPDRGVRRRSWWTFFARERLTAICQSLPCVINPKDCNIPDPSLDDFPDPTDIKAEIFVQWVRLCAIIGKVAEYRARGTDIASLAFPVHLAEDLIKWVQSLPERLKLPINSPVIVNFDRDVHQLHLHYLAIIIVLHLSPSFEPLPRAYVPAVMAATCVARIFKDYLSRGGIRFLMPVSGWICGLATLALLRARRFNRFTTHTDEDIKVLDTALVELRACYPVAEMFLQGSGRLRASESANPRAASSSGRNDDDGDFYVDASDPMVNISNGVDWVRYFPFVTAQTNGLAGALLSEHQDAPFMDEAWLGTTPFQLEELFESFAEFSGYVSIT